MCDISETTTIETSKNSIKTFEEIIKLKKKLKVNLRKLVKRQ